MVLADHAGSTRPWLAAAGRAAGRGMASCSSGRTSKPVRPAPRPAAVTGDRRPRLARSEGVTWSCSDREDRLQRGRQRRRHVWRRAARSLNRARPTRARSRRAPAGQLRVLPVAYTRAGSRSLPAHVSPSRSAVSAGVRRQPRSAPAASPSTSPQRTSRPSSPSRMTHGHAAGPVADVRHAVGPRLQQHQPERVRPARQGEHVDAGEEVALLRRRPARPGGRTRPAGPERRPEARKFGISGPASTTREARPGRPGPLRRPQQIDAPLLDAVVRQVADDDLVLRRRPTPPRARSPVAAGAVGRVHAQPLQDEPLRRRRRARRSACRSPSVCTNTRSAAARRGQQRPACV